MARSAAGMIRSAGLALGIACVAIGWTGTARAQVTNPPAEPIRLSYAPVSPNAAIRYWAVWSSIAREVSEAAGAIEWKDAEGVTDEARMPESYRAYLKVSAEHPNGIPALIQATRIPRCDFELELDQGPSVLLPHLGGFRRAARVLRADARRLLIAGDVDGAAERIAAMLRSAAHLQSDRTLISNLVEQAIVGVAVDELRTLAPRLSVERRLELRAMLLRYDPRDPFRMRQTLAIERDVMTSWLRGSTPDQIGAMMKEFESTDRAREAGEQYRKLTPAQHAEQVDRYVRSYNDMIEAWDSGDQDRLKRVASSIKPDSERYGVLASFLAADVAGMFTRLEPATGLIREGLKLLPDAGAPAAAGGPAKPKE